MVLISPRLAIQKGDFLGSGIPYWPIELATVASFLRGNSEHVFLIDLFGENPKLLEDCGDHYLQGTPISSLIWRPILSKAKYFILYAISYMSHRELIAIVKWLKEKFPKTQLVIIENTQAVTGYSLSGVSSEYFDAGANIIVCGELYGNWKKIKELLIHHDSITKKNNLIISNRIIVKSQKKIDTYPTPAWDLFKIENYWALPYSHGPKSKKFFPILTSRGCPYPCDFCVAPEITGKRWFGRSPEEVVDEIIELRDKFKVFDFQIEDLNPTVKHERWEQICKLLIDKSANIRFYFVSGTKAETIRIDKIPLFAKAGCKYISISPEYGNASIMKIIGKKFNYEHGISLVKECRKYKIRTQACFLIGHPQETEDDFIGSKNYLSNMVNSGLDEVAIFVVSPFPGSKLHRNESIVLEKKNALLSFSPEGRFGYKCLNRKRKDLIHLFLRQKLFKGMDLWLQGYRSIFGIPQTKMENLPRRVIYIYWLVLKNKIIRLTND